MPLSPLALASAQCTKRVEIVVGLRTSEQRSVYNFYSCPLDSKSESHKKSSCTEGHYIRIFKYVRRNYKGPELKKVSETSAASTFLTISVERFLACLWKTARN